jgi:hypothetical protein
MRLIPEELQLRILSYISQRELADTVSLVCRHWHVLANDASLWHSFPWKLLFSARQEQITLGTRHHTRHTTHDTRHTTHDKVRS